MADNTINPGKQSYEKFRDNYKDEKAYYSTHGRAINELNKVTPQQIMWGLGNFTAAQYKDNIDNYDQKNGGNKDGKLQISEFVESEKALAHKQALQHAEELKKANPALADRNVETMATEILIGEFVKPEAKKMTAEDKKDLETDIRSFISALKDEKGEMKSQANIIKAMDEKAKKIAEEEGATDSSEIKAIADENIAIARTLFGQLNANRKVVNDYAKEKGKDAEYIKTKIAEGDEAIIQRNLAQQFNEQEALSQNMEIASRQYIDNAYKGVDDKKNALETIKKAVDKTLTEKAEHVTQSVNTNNNDEIEPEELLTLNAFRDAQENYITQNGPIDTGINGLITEIGAKNVRESLQNNSVEKNQEKLNKFSKFILNPDLKAKEYLDKALKGEDSQLPEGNFEAAKKENFTPELFNKKIPYIMADCQYDNNGKILLDTNKANEVLERRFLFNGETKQEDALKALEIHFKNYNK